MNALYRNVSRLSEERGLSIGALEKKMGFGKSTIAKWDKNSPRIDLLKKVADYFEVSLDELTGDEEPLQCNGRVTVYSNGEAVCGCAFSNIQKMSELVRLFSSGGNVEVDIGIRREAADGGDGAVC